jgi:hypothetical protein
MIAIKIYMKTANVLLKISCQSRPKWRNTYGILISLEFKLMMTDKNNLKIAINNINIYTSYAEILDFSKFFKTS